MAVVNQTLALMEAHAQRVAITSGSNTPVLVHEITRERDEIFHPRVKSCQSYIDLKPESESGVYNLNDTVQTYCDFDSEAGKVWTLIQSFSLENKAFYKREPFYFNFPRNETRFNWNDFPSVISSNGQHPGQLDALARDVQFPIRPRFHRLRTRDSPSHGYPNIC